MSDVARFWSRHLHGLNFAEHAVCRELAEHHNEEKDECFPNMNTICDIYECSRRYVKEILVRLDTWQLITRVEWYEPDSRTGKSRQTANRYKLNLKRNFPDPLPQRTLRNRNKLQPVRPYDNRDMAAVDGAHQGRRVLKILSNRIPQNKSYLMEGLSQAFYDRAKKITFVTVAADPYLRDFIEMLPDLSKFVRHDTNLETSLIPVPLFYRFRKR